MEKKFISKRLKYWIPKDTGWELFRCDFIEDSNQVHLMCECKSDNCYGDITISADDFTDMIKNGEIIIDRKYDAVCKEEIVPLSNNVYTIIPFSELIEKIN